MRHARFAKFYRDNLDKIYRFVFFRVGGRKELAEDLTSEIFIKALNHFEKYDAEKSKSAWLFAIARNHLANHFRDSGKRPEVSLEEFDDSRRQEIESQEKSPPPLLADGFEQLLKKDAEREVWRALNVLGEKERRLVTLKHLLGYNYAEIGEIAGMSAGAAKVATHRAMKELRRLIDR